ncbi:MAG TPA: type I DNA topoisomerase [Anaerolineaceae bacterium]|nr:type I DNA topoisomerase [Anaerolineaceae bacterium]
MEIYCLKCKEKREIPETTAVFTANGLPGTRGVCPVCGTNVFKMGATPAHEGMEKPVVVKKASKSSAKSSRSTKGGKKSSSKSSQSGRSARGANFADRISMDGLGKPLVIVESPAKAQTIGRFLGNKYKVVASYGHVRDLLASRLSVDPENNFEPEYRVPNDKSKLVKKIAEIAEKSPEVYLATDPDREGESIAWHLMESADIPEEKTKRVVFHEITKPAIDAAFKNARTLDMDLVDAQQARRILDRLVGYKVSPILWRKVRSRLSAGRVQSVAVRLVVEREREIQNFVPVEYWVVSAIFHQAGHDEQYEAKLLKINDQDLELNNEKDTLATVADMKEAKYKLAEKKLNSRRNRPVAPYITSTMQQDASSRLGFLASRTMMVAQQLYEGIKLSGSEETGLITYMRTDSVNVSAQAIAEVRDYIAKEYGESYLPEKAQVYKTRAKTAQEAHEAIRPTSVHRTPEKMRAFLTPEQHRLYTLIWQRFVASQMEAQLVETLSLDITGQSQTHNYLLRATASQTVFEGFRKVYPTANPENNENPELVKLFKDVLKEGAEQILDDLNYEQKFTQPPARFSEASLILMLEENDIGRPSTYAPIISTIQTRGYVERQGRTLKPTEVGFIVNDLLVEFFPEIVDIKFTSRMEEELDEIAEGKADWVKVLQEFYTPFEKRLDYAAENMPNRKPAPKEIGRACPDCGEPLVMRSGRFGDFISCSTFPACRYTENIPVTLEMACPVCQDGDVVQKRTKRGKTFYGCSRYPECEFASWQKPIQEPCPSCGGLLTEKSNDEVVCTECKLTFPQIDGKLV